ncbi:hypothetical protein CMO92_04880 [Candidatus Woesearchaeota archaeon]|nr:hypothetical protein [Candidatus Woesearchaeota archaeon]
MITFTIAISIGILCGIITGLIPGIHVNLIATLLIASLPTLLKLTDPLSLSFFLISLSITHSFLDSIPSIYLGAPDASQALGVLPGHRYLINGKGFHAVKLTLIGSLGAIIISITTLILFSPLILFIVPFLQTYTLYLLILVVIWMILSDNNPLIAIIIFTLAGTLGVIVLNSSLSNPLFPMLSGLFGTSTLLYSLKENTTLPEQIISKKIPLNYKLTIHVLAAGAIAGLTTAILPGVGAGIAALFAMLLAPKMGDYGFMILIGSINTFNFTYSLLTLTYLEKARNGAVLAITQIFLPTKEYLLPYLSTALIAASISTLLGLILAKKIIHIMQSIPYSTLTITIILLIVILTPFLSGIQGLFILITSTSIGLLTAATKTRRIQNMACIILPVILFLI